jgi:pimeloyl-ACP methyl ester carboxylesterase
MGKELRGLFVHGVGQQGHDFADESRTWLRKACSARNVAPFFMSTHWAPFADSAQANYLKAVEAKGSAGNMAQRLVIGTLADALMYQSNELLRGRIYDLMDRQVMAFEGKTFTVFAHSLGCLIATDWLRQRPNLACNRLVTLACNIGLFNLGEGFKPVKQLHSNRWINLYAKRDMLGFPLRVDPKLNFVHDVRVNLGGLFAGWTGLVHTKYWGDRKLWSETVPKLLAL